MNEANDDLAMKSIDDIINESINTDLTVPEVPIKKNKGGGGPGGARPNAGRKTKEKEQNLIVLIRQAIADEEAMDILAEQVRAGNGLALRLYMQYRWGNPKQLVDVTTNGKDLNMPLITFFDTNESKQ